jgi:hypothetical protein
MLKSQTRHFINGKGGLMSDVGILGTEHTRMPLDKEDDFDAAQVGPAALVRLEIRYLRRDIGELKEEIRKGLDLKADRAQLSPDIIDDHEHRIRAVEQRIYWALGFGAAAGLLGGWLSKLLLH